MFECVSGIGDHRGFDFDNEYALEMLFRACVRAAGLSELAADLESRLGGRS
jgi:hypothetical protein